MKKQKMTNEEKIEEDNRIHRIITTEEYLSLFTSPASCSESRFNFNGIYGRDIYGRTRIRR